VENINLRKTLSLALVTAISLVFISPIQAYVLDGRHVLDLMVEKLGVAETLYVSQKLISYRIVPAADTSVPATGEAPQTAADAVSSGMQVATPYTGGQQASTLETIELDETLRFIFSNAFRSDARSKNSERIYIFSNAGTLTIIDGTIVPNAANRFDLFKDILLYRSRPVLADRLTQMGVDVSISSLGRFENKIAFVIGAEYPDESVNQLWVDKDTLLPMRLILKGFSGGPGPNQVEVRYMIWWNIGETRYPSRIEFYQDDNLVRVNEAKKFEENASFSKELFDIAHLKMVYPRTLSLPPVASGTPEEPSEVQKTIEEFKRIFE